MEPTLCAIMWAKVMAKKKKKGIKIPSLFTGLKEETVQGIMAILFFVLAIILILSWLDLAGFVGEMIYSGLFHLVGLGYFLLPLLLIVLSVSFMGTLKQDMGPSRMFGSTLFFVSGLGFVDLIFGSRGGLVGYYISSPLEYLFDSVASIVLLIALIIISIMIILDIRPSLAPLTNLFKRKERDDGYEDDEEEYEEDEYGEEGGEEESEEGEYGEDDEGGENEDEKSGRFGGLFGRKEKGDATDHFAFDPLGTYTPPPISLLERDKGKPDVGDIKANTNIIKRTLQNFGIQVEMDEVSIGPSVTRYALKPAEGVRLSKIIGLQNNLELALAAHPVRIEAPIPGKALVGIEVPNSIKSTIGVATLLGSSAFKDSVKPLLIALGKDITGQALLANLAKMPHILIAGATGSGKSVTIHSIIASLIYRNGPQQMRFIMIDPKRVELTLYNNIPHLLTPVITEAKKTILALKWAAREMDRRYDILEAEKVRDIDSYHRNILAPAVKKYKESSDDEETDLPENMPYILIVIDELADIMQAYPRELESAIVRLAQMSRAVGIHLILSTQRPSVNIITGLIKANIPARIALQVSSQIDSRTILDTGGAEKLLGAGDMLYISGEMSKPKRIQAPFMSEMEVKKVVKYLHKNFEDELPDTIDLTNVSSDNATGTFSASLEDDDGDELYEEAREIVLHAGKASTSYLQRKLRIGYSRAARLIDMLEERGVIGSQDGSKAREILEELPESEDEYDTEDEEEEE